jgi:hypothetical protein
LAQRSRKRRKQRKRQARGDAATPSYAKARERDEAVRASLEPLAPGERPRAVTVAAVAAAVLGLANLVALVLRYDPDEPGKTALTAVGALICALVAWGMWHARYWAVLGMQTILALAIVGGTLALLTAANLVAVVLLVAVVGPAGALFWYLIKAMARIQMPERPGAPRSPLDG